MLTLTKIENNDGLEFHIDTTTQLAYASVRATERMLGTGDGTIRKFLQSGTAEKYKTISFQIQTTQGFRTAELLSSSQIFDLAFEYNPDLAKKMGARGANIYMLGISGYKIQAIEQPKELSRKDLALMVIAESDRADALAAQIEADRGRTLLGAAIEKAEEGNVTIGEMAKMLKIGRNTYFTILRN